MFSIGEFSRIARVSKRLLQFYDEEHLLRPAFVNRSNGYRSYGAHQLAEINRILALEELGLSLGEIGRLLPHGGSDDELRARLQDRRKELEREAAISVQRLRSLEARLLSESDAPDVVIKSFAATPYLYRVTAVGEETNSWNWVRDTAHVLRASLPRRCLKTFMVTLPGDGFETRHMVLEAGATLVEPTSTIPEGFTLTELAKRPSVAAVAQTGGPDLLHTGCGSVGRYIERNGLKMLGPPREAFLEWPAFKTCEEATIESQFPVEANPFSSHLGSSDIGCPLTWRCATALARQGRIYDGRMQLGQTVTRRTRVNLTKVIDRP